MGILFLPQTSIQPDTSNFDLLLKSFSTHDKFSALTLTNEYELLRGKFCDELVVFYSSHKIVFPASGQVAEFINQVLNSQIIQSTASVQSPSEYLPLTPGVLIIGQDETGKGEMFGPMIVVSLVANQQQLRLLEYWKVRDSKKTSSREREKITKLLVEHNFVYDKVIIRCERFNSMFDEFKDEDKNLNHMLAWAHAKACENILKKLKELKIPFDMINVIIDQFDQLKAEERLKKLQSPKIQFFQRPKADATSLVVAAASNIAKVLYDQEMMTLKESYGFSGKNSEIKYLLNHSDAEKFLKLRYDQNYVQRKNLG